MADGSELVIIRDFRSRAIPRENPPNPNEPIGSVGPNVPEGYGDVHVQYPDGQLEASGYMPEVQAWQGWPTGWQTPYWDGQSAGQQVSTLGTCIDLNTRELASFPIYGMKGVQVVKLPEWANNPEPEVYSDWVEAAKQLFNTLQGSGEAILWATGRYGLNNDGAVARWVVLHPGWVNIEKVNGEITYELAGQKLDREDVCHIKYQSMPMNLRGIGPLEWAGRNLISAAALEQSVTNLATRGGIPWGVIKHPRHLNAKEATDLQNRWISAAGRRNGAPAILSGGIELQALTISPREMAMIEMRVFDESRIAAALGVPPYLVGLPQPEGGMTYANVNSIFDFHWRATLRPLAHTAATAMSAWLLPRGSVLEFNRDEYVRPAQFERAQTYEILNRIQDAHGNPVLTVDEIRMAERLIPNQPIEPEGAPELMGVLQ